jgi:hypothetical protein
VDGHKQKPVHESYDAALSAITGFKMKPTILNHSGGGFHCTGFEQPGVGRKKGFRCLRASTGL